MGIAVGGRSVSRVMFFLLCLLVFAYGQNINVRDSEHFKRGNEWGQKGRDQWGGSGNLKGKLQEPASKGGDLVDIQGSRHRFSSGVVCQSVDSSTERVVLEVTLSGSSNVTVKWASNGSSIDRQYSYSGRFLCVDPPSYCSSLIPYSSSNSCTVLNFSGGRISAVSSSSVSGGCFDTVSGMVVDVSSLARAFASSLFDYYKRTGVRLEFYKIDQVSGKDFVTARVYGAVMKNCSGDAEVNRFAEYQKNPYKAREDALAFYLLCNPDDPDMNKAVACKTLRAMDQAGGVDKSNTGLKSCSVYRSVTSGSTQRSDGKVCQPGAKVYFDGYSEGNPWCVAGSESVDFLNLRVSFWLECDFTGTGYILKGWAYWEGAPCGSVSSFPPLPQIDQPISVFSISNNLYVGNLSVNRRVGGPGDTSGSCVSEGSNPWKVFVNVNGSTSNRPVSITVNIPALSSIGCSTFTFNGDLILPGETFRNDCSDYESRCSLVNEWFVDAYNNRYQVVKDGSPVMVYKQCRELVYDNLKKTWNSSDNNLPQTPSENCAGIPRSCKDVGGKQECRIWWRIDREYSCAVTRQLPEVDTTEYSRVLNNTTYDFSSGVLSVAVLDRMVNVNVSGDSSSCPSEDRYCLVKSGKDMDTLKCERNGDSFVCPAEVSKVVEDCKCASELRQGFSYAITALGLIEQALKDKECVK